MNATTEPVLDAVLRRITDAHLDGREAARIIADPAAPAGAPVLDAGRKPAVRVHPDDLADAGSPTMMWGVPVEAGLFTGRMAA